LGPIASYFERFKEYLVIFFALKNENVLSQ